MRKNKTMRAATLLLALVLITSCFVGGTFAKYTSSKDATDTAEIAKWDVKIGTQSITDGTDTNLTLDLFSDSTIVDTVDGNADEHVTAGKIAPGTKGTFEIEVTNSSDVAATVTVTAAADENALPFTFTVATKNNESNVITMGGTQTFVVTWEWPFNADKNDNDWQSKTANATITVTAEQVD